MVPISASRSATSPIQRWRQRIRLLPTLAFLAVATFLLVTRTEPLRANWGDPWSDANVMTSGRYFAEYGFVNTAFTPTIDVGPRDENSLIYTHYPPLPDIVNGVQQALFGRMPISQHRILADILSLFSLVFFYRFIRRIFSEQIADFALPLYAVNLLWLQYADTIHHIPIYWFFGYLALDMASSWLVTPRRRTLWILGAASAVCMLASYDFAFFLPGMIGASIWCLGKRIRDREVRPVLYAGAIGCIAGVVIKALLVIWAVGIHGFVHDLIFQFQERATAEHAAPYRDGLSTILIGRIWRFFSPLFFLVLVAMGHSLWRRWRGGGKSLTSPTPLLLLAAGMPFLILFNQLFAEQYHPTLQVLPFYAVATAACIVALRAHARRLVRILGTGAFALLIVWQIRETARFPKALYDEETLDAVGDYLAQVDSRRFVITNFLVDAPARNYWRRHVVGIPIEKEEKVAPYLSSLFDDYGDRPIRYVEVSTPGDVLYDKLLYGFLSFKKKWAWIAHPYTNQKKWMPYIMKGLDEVAAEIRKYAILEKTIGKFKIYRIDPFAGDRDRLTEEFGAQTPEIDLGDPISIRNKLYGFAPVNNGSSRLTGRPALEVRFTLQGLKRVPTRRSLRAALQAYVLPSPTENHIVVRARSRTPGVSMVVELNDNQLGSAPLGTEWTEIRLSAPLAAFADDMRQIVALRLDGATNPDVDVARVTFERQY